MNLALSILSEAASAQPQSVIDKLQAYTATAEMSVAQQQLNDPDYWSSVGIITITGLLVVFLILGILIFFFWAMGLVFKTIDKKKAAKAEAAKAAAAEEAAKAAVAAAVVEEIADDEADADDDEIIAVISAAIAAYSEQDGKAYEIRSIKRRDSRTRSAWSLAGIGDNTRPF
ncbi:MAG: OadG family protein [Oscillospiraceae bacterium]|nr:OadG family protein [Oscillospiraceae bacterium]